METSKIWDSLERNTIEDMQHRASSMLALPTYWDKRSASEYRSLAVLQNLAPPAAGSHSIQQVHDRTRSRSPL